MLAQILAASCIALVGWMSLTRNARFSFRDFASIHAAHAIVGLMLFYSCGSVPLHLRGGVVAAVGIGMAPISGLLLRISRERRERHKHGVDRDDN